METYPVSPGVLANIDKARKLVQGRKPNARFRVSDAARCVKEEYAGIDERHLRHGKLKDEPVLVVRIGGFDVLIDGWHRAVRAHIRKTRKYLPAHRLTDEEFRSITYHVTDLKPLRKKPRKPK